MESGASPAGQMARRGAATRQHREGRSIDAMGQSVSRRARRRSAECVARFERLLAGDCASEAELVWRETALAHRSKLKGKNLACWCALPEPGRPDICHAAALLRFASE
jgi:hypothetical protein